MCDMYSIISVWRDLMAVVTVLSFVIYNKVFIPQLYTKALRLQRNIELYLKNKNKNDNV